MFLICQQLAASSIDAYVLGEHGDSQFVSCKKLKDVHLFTKIERLLGRLPPLAESLSLRHYLQLPLIEKYWESCAKRRRSVLLRLKVPRPLVLVPSFHLFAHQFYVTSIMCDLSVITKKIMVAA